MVGYPGVETRVARGWEPPRGGGAEVSIQVLLNYVDNVVHNYIFARLMVSLLGNKL